jgi:hypothetical protein
MRAEHRATDAAANSPYFAGKVRPNLTHGKSGSDRTLALIPKIRMPDKSGKTVITRLSIRIDRFERRKR